MPSATDNWDAAAYAQRSALQRAMGAEVIALLRLGGHERVLDVGCGNGVLTAQIASRVPDGQVVGVDSSRSMIEFAQANNESSRQDRLRFEIADARSLAFREEFDLVVSVNALHWVPEQEQALKSIYLSLKKGGVAQLRLVPAGECPSLEETIEETRLTSTWNTYFHEFNDPYLHLTSEQYASLAERCGFHVVATEVVDKTWDFGERDTFIAFCSAMLKSWTARLPPSDQSSFITDVLDRYRRGAAGAAHEENCFRFYQMDITLLKPA